MTSSPSSTPVTELGTVGALLASVVDYAGLFPPAGLNMPEAAENYARYLLDADSWILGSFVLPLSRVGELGDALKCLHNDGDLSARDIRRLPVSIILPPLDVQVAEELASVRECFREQLVVGSLEVRPMSADAIESNRSLIGPDLDLFFEVPLGENCGAELSALAEIGAKAKFRTGGISAPLIPTCEALASGIEVCARLGVPFKVTAGLHHPIRSLHCLTYEDHGSKAIMHGFVNVLVASTLRFGGMINEAEIVEILSETNSEAFRLGCASVSWEDRSFGVEQAARCRRSFFHSFGSCSFVEPIHDLRELGIL